MECKTFSQADQIARNKHNVEEFELLRNSDQEWFSKIRYEQ